MQALKRFFNETKILTFCLASVFAVYVTLSGCILFMYFVSLTFKTKQLNIIIINNAYKLSTWLASYYVNIKREEQTNKQTN